MGALLLFWDLVRAEWDWGRCSYSVQAFLAGRRLGALQAGSIHPVGIAPAGTEAGQPQRMEAGRSIPPFPGSPH